MLALALVLALGSADSVHHVRSDAAGIVIDSAWDDTRQPLAHPLPPGAVLNVLDRKRLRVTVPPRDATDALPLPLPDGDGVHRVTFDRDLAFRPATSLDLAPRGTQTVGRGVHGADIRRVDADFGPAPSGGGTAHYLSTDALTDNGGLAGRLQDAGRRRERLLLLAAGAFVFVVATLAALARSVRKRADLERADAVLTREIEELQA